jgi:hypothetical protein
MHHGAQRRLLQMHELWKYERLFVRGKQMTIVAEQIFLSSESSPEFLMSSGYQGHSLARIECTFVERGPMAQTIHKCRELLCGALLVLNSGIPPNVTWSPNLSQSTAIGRSCSERKEIHRLITRQLEKAQAAGDL